MSIVALVAINTLLFLARFALSVLSLSLPFSLFLSSLPPPPRPSLSFCLYTPSSSFYLDSVTFDPVLSSPGVPPATITKIAA